MSDLSPNQLRGSDPSAQGEQRARREYGQRDAEQNPGRCSPRESVRKRMFEE